VSLLKLVKRVEVKVWVPEEAATFFRDVAEFNDSDYEYQMLTSLSGYVDYAFFTGVIPRAEKVKALLDQLIKELRDGED
jgi:hypothetical protein